MSFDWDKHADGWDQNPDVVVYAKHAFASLTEVIDCTGLRVFDFGCGTGLLTERIAPTASAVVALDPAPKMLDVLARKKIANVTPIAGWLTSEMIAREPAFENKCDLITASSVCAFVPDYPETLQLLRTLLVPGGKLVQWDWLATSGEPDFGLTEAGIHDAITAAGFTDIAITQPFSISRGDEGPMPVLMAVASERQELVLRPFDSRGKPKRHGADRHQREAPRLHVGQPLGQGLDRRILGVADRDRMSAPAGDFLNLVQGRAHGDRRRVVIQEHIAAQRRNALFFGFRLSHRRARSAAVEEQQAAIAELRHHGGHCRPARCRLAAHVIVDADKLRELRQAPVDTPAQLVPGQIG